MVLIKKEIVQPEYKHYVVVKIVCDICGAENPGDDWSTGHYEVNKTTIEYESGDHYPGDRFTTFLCCDICPTCFVHKLMPWVESHGIGSVREEDRY